MVYVLDQYLKSLVHVFSGESAKRDYKLGPVTSRHVRLSTRVNETSQLLLDGLSIFYTWLFFQKMSQKFKFH